MEGETLFQGGALIGAAFAENARMTLNFKPHKPPGSKRNSRQPPSCMRVFPLTDRESTFTGDKDKALRQDTNLKSHRTPPSQFKGMAIV